MTATHSLTSLAYCRVLRCPRQLTRLGNKKSSSDPLRCSSQAQQAAASICHKLELHRPICLLPYDGRSVPNASTSNNVADFHLHDVATSKLAVYREIKQCAVTQSAMLIQIEADRPDVTGFQWSFGTDKAASIPRPTLVRASTEVHYPQVLKGFHIFAVDWEPEKISWLVDGRVYAVRSASEWFSGGSGKPGAPFDQPFHLILNLAIGGHLPETRGAGGVDPVGFPKRFEIDWVRIWRKHGDLPISRASNPGTGE